MALYAIGDTHLSLTSNKPMDVFGGGWEGYVDKLQKGFAAVGPEDTVVLCGDLSWGMSLEEAKGGPRFPGRLPGARKLLLKGNHDYWWNTAAKMERFFREHELTTMEILHNNCKFYGELALCGTRGWFYELDNQGTHDEKVLLREIGRLETSLKAAGGAREAGVSPLSAPVSGLPLPGDPAAAEGVRREAVLLTAICTALPTAGPSRECGMERSFRWMSADYLKFVPKKICE